MNMKPLISVAALALLSGCAKTNKEVLLMNSIYDAEVKTISGEPIKLDQYKGKVLLIVNTASKCGFTGQYEGLQALYETYQDQDFIILGFPSNDFMNQEPGTNEEIASFCKRNYGVTFPMFEKISVKGKYQHPLYTFLTAKETNPEYAGKISWNFNKFLISKSGEIVNRFGSQTKPLDSQLVSAIENELGERR